jgi:hypothetical protein
MNNSEDIINSYKSITINILKSYQEKVNKYDLSLWQSFDEVINFMENEKEWSDYDTISKNY